MRRVVIVVPSLFTLFNLFFGIWSMVLASRGEFYRAGWYIFFAGVLDALDGRVARLARTGTRFGAELDSLVDVVSFGVAPAFLIYQLEFAVAGQAEWIFCYFYVMAAAIRLARFNITQAGRAKRSFIGLPSPAAGMTLATFFPFTTTELYQHLFRLLPRHHLMQLLMILLTILMVSNVRYATFPRAALLDLQGQAVEHALHALGFGEVARVRMGKHLVLEVTAASRDEALERARAMCDRLLANPVTEDYDLAVDGGAAR